MSHFFNFNPQGFFGIFDRLNYVGDIKINPKKYDLIIVGAGPIAADLLSFLEASQEKFSDFEILILDSNLKKVGTDDAGTFHVAFSEAYGLKKSIEIHQRAILSLLVDRGLEVSGKISRGFYNNIPHSRVAFGKNASIDLQKKAAAFAAHPFFENMKFLDKNNFHQKYPHIKEGAVGTYIKNQLSFDVNFGGISNAKINYYEQNFENITVRRNFSVKKVMKSHDRFTVEGRNKDEALEWISADKISVLAGPNAMEIMHGSDLPSAEEELSKEYIPFPVKGKFLLAWKPNIVALHKAKLYEHVDPTRGGVPMSDPHLDLRFLPKEDILRVLSSTEKYTFEKAINSGEIKMDENRNFQVLLFGPYAGFRLRYSNIYKDSGFNIFSDLFLNITNTLLADFRAFKKNPSMVWYLLRESFRTKKSQMKKLYEFIPDAKYDDWTPCGAGIRNQILKKSGDIEFGTEVVKFEKGLVALFGASPGATHKAYLGMLIAQMLGYKISKKVNIPMYEEWQKIFSNDLEVVRENYSKILEYFKRTQ